MCVFYKAVIVLQALECLSFALVPLAATLAYPVTSRSRDPPINGQMG